MQWIQQTIKSPLLQSSTFCFFAGLLPCWPSDPGLDEGLLLATLAFFRLAFSFCSFLNWVKHVRFSHFLSLHNKWIFILSCSPWVNWTTNVTNYLRRIHIGVITRSYSFQKVSSSQGSFSLGFARHFGTVIPLACCGTQSEKFFFSGLGVLIII